MTLPDIKEGNRFTYADYLTWDDDQRRELINGEAFCMSPGPNRRHQELLLALARTFADYLTTKIAVFLSPRLMYACLPMLTNQTNDMGKVFKE